MQNATAAGSGTFDALLREERRFPQSAAFAAPGIVRVYCNIHPDMAGYVVVLAPGAAQTFIIGVTADAVMPTTDIGLTFRCAGAGGTAPSRPNVNTLSLSASTAPAPTSPPPRSMASATSTSPSATTASIRRPRLLSLASSAK